MMTSNDSTLSDYIHTLQPEVLFFRPYERIPVKHSTRLCVQCGSPYVISTPYELCNPDVRDLCDDCIFPETEKERENERSRNLHILRLNFPERERERERSLSSGSDPDLIRAAEKARGTHF